MKNGLTATANLQEEMRKYLIKDSHGNARVVTNKIDCPKMYGILRNIFGKTTSDSARKHIEDVTGLPSGTVARIQTGNRDYPLPDKVISILVQEAEKKGLHYEDSLLDANGAKLVTGKPDAQKLHAVIKALAKDHDMTIAQYGESVVGENPQFCYGLKKKKSISSPITARALNRMFNARSSGCAVSPVDLLEANYCFKAPDAELKKAKAPKPVKVVRKRAVKSPVASRATTRNVRDIMAAAAAYCQELKLSDAEANRLCNRVFESKDQKLTKLISDYAGMSSKKGSRISISYTKKEFGELIRKEL